LFMQATLDADLGAVKSAWTRDSIKLAN
jgi:hypothetical protein